jgi:hypothetical protein
MATPSTFSFSFFNFTSCRTDTDGAAYYQDSSEGEAVAEGLLVVGCTGKTIFCKDAGHVKLTDCEFYHNHPASGNPGGVIGCNPSSSAMRLFHCIFAWNDENRDFRAGTKVAEMKDCVFSGPLPPIAIEASSGVQTAATTATLVPVFWGTHYCPTPDAVILPSPSLPFDPTVALLMSALGHSSRFGDSDEFVLVSDRLSETASLVLSAELPASIVYNSTNQYRFSAVLVDSVQLNGSVSIPPSYFPATPVSTVAGTRTNSPEETDSASFALTNSGLEEQKGGNPKPAPESNNLGLILGIVFGVLAVIGAVAAFVVYRLRPRKEETAPPEDPNAEFIWLQQRAQEVEMSSVDFNNPVYDGDTRVGDGSDAFAASTDELL